MHVLRSCVWELTLACCFSCRYCGSGGGKARQNELSTKECLDISNQLSDIGCKYASLIGGEVFLRSDWDIIAKSLVTGGVRTSIITNGYRMSEEILEKMIECGIQSVAVSLDGPKGVHDEYRHPGSYDRAIGSIMDIASHGIPVSVISTLNNKNASRLVEFYSFLQQLPIFAWQIQACSPMGNAWTHEINFHVDFHEVLQFVADHVEIAPFKMGVADNIGYFTDEEGFVRGNTSGFAVFSGCQAGITSIGIDSVGNVRGCESMYADCFIEGNLRKKTLKEIWNDPNAFSYNRKFTQDMLTGKCAVCPHGEYCKAGCRSYNFFVHGKMYESPSCACICT